ncbi:MAG: GNAT family N-acetyltransferase [Spirochaeta sp.]
MEIRRIQWQDTIELRHRVLWPTRNQTFCHVEGDADAWHFGAFLPEGLVSVASVYPEGETARLRKFATAHEHQRKGIGTQMLTHILSDLRDNGFSQFWCDARESAMSFYERFGMKPEGERFFKEDIPYYKMSVQLLAHQIT